MKRLSRAPRILAVLAVLCGGLLLGPRAGAEPHVSFEVCEESASEPTPTPEPSPTPTPTPTPSPGPCTPPEGSVVAGEVVVVFNVEVDDLDELREVTLSIESGTEGVPPPENPVRRWEDPEPGQFQYFWDTRGVPAHNGAFDLVVRAWTEHPVNGREDAPPEVHQDLRVDNPPQTPERPRVAGVTGEGVTVEWPKAPEPDVLHYTLFRARTDSEEQVPDAGAFKEARVTEKTSVLDEVANDGAYWYKIQVTRRSIIDSDGGIASQLSARSDEAGVYVVPTPTPAPTPPPDGGDGGPAGGGETESTPRPRLTPRPLPRPDRSGPPLPSDAPFSDTLPYDLPEDGSGSGGADLAQGAEGDVGEPGDQGPLPAVAIGTFLVSAALALGRLPTA